MDELLYWLAVLLLTWCLQWGGVKNAMIYARTGRSARSRLPRWIGVHEAEVLAVWPLYAMAVAAGLHPLHVMGAALVAGLPFKGWINLSGGRPFVDPEETADVDRSGRPGYEVFGVAVPQPFYGRGRWLGVALGLLLWAWRLLLEVIM